MSPEQLPSPPPCPAWCEAEHDPSGWDEAETKAGGLTSVSKGCQRSIDFLSIDSGYVEVVLDRLAAADLTGKAWGGTYVCDPYVRLLSDAPIILSLKEAEQLARTLRSACAEEKP